MDNQPLIGNLSAFLERASRRLIERKTDELMRFGIEDSSQGAQPRLHSILAGSLVRLRG